MHLREQPSTQPHSTPAEADRVAATLELLFRLTRRVSPVGEFSLTSYLVLARLTRDGVARVTELADFEGVTQPGMTQIATRLRSAGLIEQIPDPSDGRAMLLSITPAGAHVLAERRSARASGVAELLDQLSPDDQAAVLAAVPALENLARLALETTNHA